MRNHINHAGFTLAETVITVAVMGLLIAMLSTPLAEYMKKHRQREEAFALSEIRDALIGFAEAYNRLPSHIATDNTFCQTTVDGDGDGLKDWNDCLAPFTRMSVQSMEEDTWGNSRVYVMYTRNETLLNRSDIPVYYASVFGQGANRRAENIDKKGTTIQGIPVNGTDFGVSANGGWWSNNGSEALRVARFEDLRPGGDDHMLKYSDLSLKAEKYHETQRRILGIEAALSQYADIRYQEEYSAQVAAGTADVDELLGEYIFFPPAQELKQISLAAYANRVRTDVNNQTGSSSISISNDNGTRLNAMIGFVRLLGLPDYFCCDALSKDYSLSSAAQEVPFFYYSNPILPVGGGCQTRSLAVPFNSPSVQVEPNACEY